MAATANIGTGTTFTKSGFSYQITNVSLDGVSIAAIEASKMSSTDAKDYIAGTLVDNGTVTLEIEWDGSSMPTLGGAASSCVIDWGGLGNTLTGDGFIESISAVAPLEDKMTATIVVRATGVWS